MAVVTLGTVQAVFDHPNRKWQVSHPDHAVDHYCDDVAIIELGHDDSHPELILHQEGRRALIYAEHIFRFPNAKVLARTHGREVQFGS